MCVCIYCSPSSRTEGIGWQERKYGCQCLHGACVCVCAQEEVCEHVCVCEQTRTASVGNATGQNSELNSKT